MLNKLKENNFEKKYNFKSLCAIAEECLHGDNYDDVISFIEYKLEYNSCVESYLISKNPELMDEDFSLLAYEFRMNLLNEIKTHFLFDYS